MSKIAKWAVASVAVACVVVACVNERSTEDDDDGPGSGSGAAATTGVGAMDTTIATMGNGGGGPCGHTGEPEQGLVVGITAAHNAERCAVETATPIPLLSWSTSLAAVAQAYADELAGQGCNLVHSGGPYGENLFWGSASYPPNEVVAAWMSEESCYTHTTFPDCCGCTCGHYTQILWRESTTLGCGVGACAGGGQVWVCNYDPPGN